MDKVHCTFPLRRLLEVRKRYDMYIIFEYSYLFNFILSINRAIMASVVQAEMLLECLEVGAAYSAELEEYNAGKKRSGREDTAPPQPPAIMVAYHASTPGQFLQEILVRIKSRLISSLNSTFLFLYQFNFIGVSFNSFSVFCLFQ